MYDMLLNMFEQICLYMPLIFGAYISFSMLKVPNLSIETAYVCGAIIASKMLALSNHAGFLITFFAACLGSLAGGLFVGLIVSLLVTYGKLPPLLASILTIGLFHGINLFLLGGSNSALTNFDNPLTAFALQGHPELIMLGIISIVVIALSFLLLKTQLGSSFAIYGNNPSFFQHYGISGAYVIGCGLALSNMLAGLSGYLVAQTSGFVDINAGTGISLFCLTGLILSKNMFKRRKIVTILIPVVGLILYCLIQQLLLKAGFNLKYFTMIQSIIVLLFLMYIYRGKSAHELLGDHLGV